MPNPEKSKFSRRARKKGYIHNVVQYKGLPYQQLKSKAWRRLSGNSIKIYLELCTRFHGANNGDLSLSYIELINLFGMSRSTISNSFKELEQMGFIKKNKIGTFYGRRATTFILTDERYKDHPPTKEWRNYSPSFKRNKITFGINSVLKDAYEEVLLTKIKSKE